MYQNLFYLSKLQKQENLVQVKSMITVNKLPFNSCFDKSPWTKHGNENKRNHLTVKGRTFSFCLHI